MIFDVHSDLKRYVSAAFLVSADVGVFGIFFLTLGLVRAPSWPFVIFVIVAILTAYLATAIVPRHYRYASRVVASVTPTPQRIVLELPPRSMPLRLIQWHRSAQAASEC